MILIDKFVSEKCPKVSRIIWMAPKKFFWIFAQVYKADDEMGRLEYDGDWSEGKKCGKGMIKWVAW